MFITQEFRESENVEGEEKEKAEKKKQGHKPSISICEHVGSQIVKFHFSSKNTTWLLMCKLFCCVFVNNTVESFKNSARLHKENHVTVKVPKIPGRCVS